MLLSSEVPFANATQNAEDATQRGRDTEAIRLVDERAFPGILNVLVKLSVLGIDGTLWGDLQKFSGVVRSRYYHPVTNLPMYTVDFGGGIGQRIIRVCDTELDRGKQFATNPGGSLERDGMGGSTADGNQHQRTEMSRGDSDDDDPVWEAGFEDFNCSQASGESSFSDTASFVEEPMKELGIYEYHEDVSGWCFDKLFADDQWQDQATLFLHDTSIFTGPLPGPTSEPAEDAEEYFRRYWPDGVLQRIVAETNRLVFL